jgi:5-methyltetrahydrofolate--homocysteine methyltransferase
MEELTQAMIKMDEDKTMALTDQYLKDGADPMKVLDAFRDAMSEVGRLFEAEEYYLPELIMAGEMLRIGSEKVKPYIINETDTSEKKGKVIIATVAGDVHDIGKDIVTMMLDLNGYDVLDLGIDVPVQKIAEAAKDFKPSVIGLSGFLTLAYDPMKDTIAAVKNENLGDIKFMIGGGQMDDQVKEYVGADAYGSDAMSAVRLCDEWISA